jgi:hypothetical protein
MNEETQLKELDKKLSYFIGEFKQYQTEHNKIHNDLSNDIKAMMEFILPFKSIPVVLGVILALGTIISGVIGGLWWIFNHLK